MDIRDMAAEENIRTSNVIKEQHKKHEKFVARESIFSPSSFAKTKKGEKI